MSWNTDAVACKMSQVYQPRGFDNALVQRGEDMSSRGTCDPGPDITLSNGHKSRTTGRRETKHRLGRDKFIVSWDELEGPLVRVVCDTCLVTQVLFH